MSRSRPPTSHDDTQSLAWLSGASVRELVESVEIAIQCGSLPPDTQLPSVRALARAASVSHATASTALSELRRRGLVVTEARRRSRVAPRPPLAMSVSSVLIPPGVRDLRHGGPDRELLPDLRPALHRAADEQVAPRLYGLPQVEPELGDIAISEFRASGINVEEVAVCGGALDAIERALAASLHPGDSLAVEDPGYADLFDLARALGLRLVPVAVDSHGPVPEGVEAAIRSGIKAVAITPAGQNPFGAAMTAERAAQLNELLRAERHLLLIEDHHLGPVGPVPVSASSGLERWLVVRTLSKAFGPDLRLALVAGDPATLARVKGRLAVGSGWISHHLQRTAVHLLRDRRHAEQLRKVSHTYDRRRRALLDELLARGLDAVGESGLNVWVPVPEESRVVVALTAAGWAVAPGTLFRIDSPPAVRITTSTLLEHEAGQVADAVAATLLSRRERSG